MTQRRVAHLGVTKIFVEVPSLRSSCKRAINSLMTAVILAKTAVRAGCVTTTATLFGQTLCLHRHKLLREMTSCQISRCPHPDEADQERLSSGLEQTSRYESLSQELRVRSSSGPAFLRTTGASRNIRFPRHLHGRGISSVASGHLRSPPLEFLQHHNEAW